MTPLYWDCVRSLALVAGLLSVPMVTHCEPVDLTVASGHLGAGAFGLFNFTLERDVGAGESLKIGTAGSNFDTEIALYDRLGRLVATNDNISPRNRLSELSFGGVNALAAGHYTVALSGFNTIFRTGDIVPGSGKEGDFQLTIQSTQSVALPLISSYLAMDGHILPNSIEEIQLGQGWLEAHGVRQFDFILQEDLSSGDWLAIHTQGSGFDTEIGLYDARGKLLAKNDNLNPRDPQSRLSFGLDGDSGGGLSAGAYTVLLGGFNTIFREDLVTQSSFNHGGDFELYVQSSGRISMTAQVTPGQSTHAMTEPSTLLLTGLGALMLLRRRSVVARPTTLAPQLTCELPECFHSPEYKLFQLTKNHFKIETHS